MGEMDKTYSNGEMVDMLLENPKREAIIKGETILNNKVIVDEDNDIVWEYNRALFIPKPCHKNRRWIVLEPPKKLKEMSFGDTMFHFQYNNFPHSDGYKSIITGETLEKAWSTISKEAYLGLWTVEGVYEDD